MFVHFLFAVQSDTYDDGPTTATTVRLVFIVRHGVVHWGGLGTLFAALALALGAGRVHESVLWIGRYL